MAASSIPPKPPQDDTLSAVTWGWLKFAWQWVRGEANVTPVITTSITLSDSFTYPFDATSGNLIATLPLANTCLGKKYLIKRVDASAHTITITASGSDLIDGSATQSFSAQYQELEIVSDGVATWHIIGFFSVGAASGPAGGANNVQFNNGGVFGGSSNFTWTPSTNTLAVVGTIRGGIQDTGGQVANVKAYGAKGDGVTDDTTAIQLALSSGFGTIFFPKASYKTTAPLTFTSGDRTIIEGNGSIITLVDATGLLDVIQLGNNTGNPFGVVLQNIVVRRSEVATTGAGIKMDRANGCKLINVTVFGNNQIFYGIDVYRTIDAWIIDCDIEKCVSDGILLHGTALTVTSTNAHIFDNLIQNNGGNGINVSDFTAGSSFFRNVLFNNTLRGIVLNASLLANTAGDFEISQNNIDTNLAGGIYMSKYGNIRLNDNWFSSNAGNTIINFVSDSTNLVMTGNLIYGVSTLNTIEIGGLQATITGNQIYGGLNTIVVDSTAVGTTITGNTIRNSSGWGIDLNANPDKTTIVGNTFLNNVSGNIRIGSSTLTVIAGNDPASDPWTGFNTVNSTIGNVGIGVTPASKLHVFVPTGIAGPILANSLFLDSNLTAVGDGGTLSLGTGGAQFTGIKAFIDSSANNSAGSLRFYTRTVNTDANLTEHLRIDAIGDLVIPVAGNGLKIKEGSNARMGSATLVLGVAVVSNTSVTANSRIFLSVESLGTVTVPTTVSVTARTPGTSFTITSANLTDTSVIAWHIMEPA